MGWIPIIFPRFLRISRCSDYWQTTPNICIYIHKKSQICRYLHKICPLIYTDVCLVGNIMVTLQKIYTFYIQ